MFGRMVSAEKIARQMFDKQMQVNNVLYNGKTLQYEDLSRLAQQDLPKAVELMSKLTIEGKLNSETLQKMFTARHFMEIKKILIDMNGNVDSFVNGIAKGVDYTLDFQKNMFNANNQIEILKNNIFALSGDALQYGKESIGGLLMMINNTGKEFEGYRHEFKELIPQIGSLLTVTGTTYIAIGSLVRLVQTLGGALTASGTSILGALGITIGTGGTSAIIAGIIASIYMLGKAYSSYQKNLFDKRSLINNLNPLMEKSNTVFQKLNGNITFAKNQLNELNNVKVDLEMSNTLDIFNGIIAKSKELYDTMETLSTWQPINISSYEEDITKIENRLLQVKERIESTNKDINDELLKTVQYELKKRKISDDELDKVIELFKYYQKIKTQTKDTFTIYNSLGGKIHELNLGNTMDDFKFYKNIVEDIEDNVDFKFLEEGQKNIDDFNDKAKEIGTTLDTIQGEQGKLVQKNSDINNKAIAYVKSEYEKLFTEFGKVQIGEYIYEGFEGGYEMFIEGQDKALKFLKENINKTIVSTEEEIDKLTNKELTEKDVKKLNDLNEELNNLYITKKNLSDKNAVDILGKDFVNNLSQGIENTKELRQIMFTIIALQYQFNLDKLMKPLDRNAIKSWEGVIGAVTQKLHLTNEKEQDKIAKSQKNIQTYQIKYNNYLKESLNLEKELEKINNSKGMQDAIEFKYKIKQLNLDQSILEKEKEQHKLALKRLQVTKELEGYKNIVLNANDSKTMQSVIDSLYERYKGELKGDSGKSIKDFFEAIKQYTQTTSKSENLIKQEELEKIKKFREELESIPEAFVNSRKALMDISNMNFMDRNGRFEDYIQSLQDKFNDSKNKIYQSYAINSDLSIGKALEDSLSEIDFVKTLKSDTNLSDIKQELVKMFGEDFMKMFDEQYYSKEKGNYVDEATIILIDIILKKNQDLIKLNQEQLNQKTEELKKQQAIADAYAKTANFMGKLSNITGIEAIGKLGDIVSATGEMTDFLSNPENSFSLKDIFTPQDTKEWADNLSKAMESAFKGMEMGTAVGGLVGNFIGGSQGASMAGGLAGMVTGAMGMTGWGALGIQAGASILGGLLDNSEKDKAEAERKTKEANKIYNKNTEALQKLSQNMSSLNGGVDGLNNTLISYFSKIPTIDNINNVTDAMKNMYATMEKTRLFNDVAYQVTKTKKKKGFLGIGGGSTSWTETIEVSVQEMLNRYGFKGAIEDMTSQQLRDFSKWLDDYDLGDSDNFGILADALENYAEALDKFDKNIDNFFRDTTMEAFEGISSLQQEDLRQQIEEFYKNLGLQIDEETSKQIDKLAEEMSVMVTIMTDVRSEFINSWRSSGMDAGKAFLSSMTPYIDAMLNNISQIYYDVYFSGVNEILEKEFKTLSEKLVELKKQGKDLEWDNVAKELQGSFEHILGTIQSVESETESFNNILLQLQKQAMESGLSLSEIFQLGLTTDTQKSVIEAFKSSIGSGEMNSGLKAIGDLMGDKVGEALVNKMIDNMFGEKILQLSAQIDKAMSGNLGFGDLAGLANEALGVGMMLESERLRLEAIKDMFSFDSDISYNTDESVNYSSGTSQSITNIYNVSSTVQTDSVITADSVEKLADNLLDIMLEKLKVDRGITLK